VDLLDRLYERLLTALEASGVERGSALTVGDLYQLLIPYRAIRADLGVMELAQYEHALLRLLSGERSFLEVDDPAVREEFQRELASPSPILGIYRDYAAAHVSLVSAAPVAGAPPRRTSDSSARQSPTTADGTADAPARPSRTPPLPPSGKPPPVADSPPPPELPAASPPRAGSVTTCADCSRPLPSSPDVRFCPYCGAPQGPIACSACGTHLEGGWSFCIRCGTPREDAAP
jgi:hypothetical protein